MSVPVVSALTGADWEAQLLAALTRPGSGITLVRRCVDVTDLLAAAATGQGRAVLVAGDLRRFDAGVIDRLHTAQMAVVVIGTSTGPSPDQWRQAGADDVVSLPSPGLQPVDWPEISNHVATALVAAVALRTDPSQPTAAGGSGPAWADPAGALAPAAAPIPTLPGNGPRPVVPTTDLPPSQGSEPTGQLVAVWGPTGAPGRTTVAVNLAAELAALGVSTLLADADVYGGVVAQVLGLLDESAGLAAAVRLTTSRDGRGDGLDGHRGGLDVAALARLAPLVSPGLRVLTGLPRADRWLELRPSAVEAVWAAARGLADLVVVDCGFNLERDEELTFDTLAPRRNGVTLVTLEHADLVVAVARGDPVGLARFARALPALREAAPGARLQVVVTQVRPSLLGPDAHGQVMAALHRYAGVADAVLLPDDRPAVDRAMIRGQTLAEAAPGSPLRRALTELARGLTDDLRPATSAGRTGRAGRPGGAGRAGRAGRLGGAGRAGWVRR